MTSTLVLGVKSCLPRSPGFPRRTRRLIVVRLLQCLQNALDARGDFPGRESFRTFVILHGRSHSAGMARPALLLYLAEVGSEESRVGTECVSQCRSRWSPCQ